MFAKDKREKFSLRKYKDGRTDSKLIGATILATGVALAVGASPVAAAVTSNGGDSVTLVSDTSKVASTEATTFTDDSDASKTVKVDAVLAKDTPEPTKANNHTGDADGSDVLNFKSEATVNYKLDSDKSDLKPAETVKTGEGSVTTPYDKKGLSYDTDGKDYRESTVTKTGDAVTEATGKKDTVEANNKVYEYVRSEVENADKATYDKTNFNNIEARVSPEGMHNKLGEIDYTKTKGKVYLVEETADGQYGKYVVAENGVSSDEDAATQWKNGQADAKEFTKENVTLEEGDTVLVLDKDTYAIGAGKEVKVTKKGIVTYETVNSRTDTYVLAKNDYNSYRTEDYSNDVGDYAKYRRPGADGIFGTADDIVEAPRSNPTYGFAGIENFNGPHVYNPETREEYAPGKIDAAHSSLKDVLKNYALANYKALDYLEKVAVGEENKAKVQAARTRLDNHLKELEDKIQDGTVEIGLLEKKSGTTGTLVEHAPLDDNLFPQETKLSEYLKFLPDALGRLSFTNVTSKTEDTAGVHKKITTTTEYSFEPEYSDANIQGHSEVVTEEYPIYNGIPEVDFTEDPKTEEKTTSTILKKGTITISQDGKITVSGDSTVDDDFNTAATSIGNNKYIIDREVGTRTQVTTTPTTEYNTKEIITPVRAYKVMGEAKPVVTHYYNLKITKEEAGEATATKQGSVVIKYVTTDGKQLKSETDKDNVTLETKTIVSLYSGETKVDERTDVKPVEQNYDTTPKQYPTLVDADTGFTYEYVGLKQGSPAASGKVVEGTTEVVYEYRLVSEEEKTPSKSEVTKTGSVDVKHVVINEDGTLKTLKETEVVKNNVPLEYEDTYVTYSKGVKVSERKEKRAVTEKYDTTDKQYPTLKDEATGLVYKYVGPTSDSAPATGDVTEGEKHVIYSYVLDKKEDATPTVTEAKGSVVVKYVDADGNEIKDSANVVTDAVVKTTKTYATKSGEVVLSTRDEVTENDVNYNTVEKKVDTITKDGKKYVFRGVYEVSDKYNNVLEETGKVKEGTTTVVYQYDYVIPVDPTKPNEGDNNPPKPEDKIPNDPQNRSYKDLGLLKEVKRDITYVYENGPKAGQEASAPVNQNARFTRTAEINSRTGEVVYTSEWTKEQKLAEVVSPKIDKYAVDKEKVAELPVTHESSDSSEVVKYRENPEIIEHDEAKDKKGSVVVKYVDGQGNEIGEAVTVKDNVIVEKAMTKVYADREETTYTATNEEYSTVANRKDVIEANGKKYKYSGVYEVSDKYNNVLEETGRVKEGTTTVVYQYDYIIPVDPTKPNNGEQNPPKPEDKIPNDPKGRTYKDLGLLTEVKRNITYVYENGPKAGQEASAPVEQTARFTRTAEINSRTGEVVYTSEWTKEQKLAEVASPEIKDYTVDKAKVDELAVTHESKDSAVVVKYSQNKPNSVRDYAKDKKGTVIVKFVDINENFLADDVVAKNNVIVAEATTITTGDKEETTYKATGEEYAVTAPETIEVDGVTFKLKRVFPAGDKFKNTVEEKGLVKEGVTTIVYQYVMQIDAPKVEVPEFEGGVVPLDPPTVEIPELKIPEEPKPQPTPTPTPEPNPAPAPTPQPTPTPQRNETPKPPVPVAEDSETPEVSNKPVPSNYNPDGNTYPAPSTEVTQLPNTGTESNAALAAFGFVGMLSGLSIVLRKKDSE
ncbi:SIALI-17 repeat-containing surface protein [Streptococcus mitis]|uniref:SIALI-17 repeat-containing surface protein n=1 Tax=Streptococcus mitis TaxID=28037 RepID=UPI0021B752AA|nr:SIALI-17 repeat-containing surface protein [Streptococcus mitis]